MPASLKVRSRMPQSVDFPGGWDRPMKPIGRRFLRLALAVGPTIVFSVRGRQICGSLGPRKGP